MTGISKRFPGVVALDNVTFTVHAGEAVGLVGENGAGKSTLMKILAGLQRPDAGELRVDDRPVTLHAPVDAARLGIGVIHQELEIVDNLDVAGNVFLGREPLRGGPLRLVDTRQMYARTADYLARLGVDIPVRTPLARLSTAQQQLVAIARAFSMDARVLIMDEPTSSLTLDDTARLFRVLKDLRAGGVTIIYISHRLGEIEELADRVVVLRDGRNAGELTRAEVTRERLVQLMVGREVSANGMPEPPVSVTPLVELEGVRTQRYPDIPVSLSLRRGEILGISGLIGAGRTELAEALCGVTPAVGGRVTLEGRTLVLRAPRDAIRQGVYLVPEDRRRCGLVLTSCVRENISLPSLTTHARLGIVDRAAETAAAVKVAANLRVKAASQETVAGTLSGGNQQKVVLAKWLPLAPRVIVFDEPTRGIDVGAKAEIYRLMRMLADEGAAVVMISSDMEEILANSHRVAVMHEGRVTGVLDRAGCSPESIMRLAVA